MLPTEPALASFSLFSLIRDVVESMRCIWPPVLIFWVETLELIPFDTIFIGIPSICFISSLLLLLSLLDSSVTLLG